jgi:hypothetical protein
LIAPPDDFSYALLDGGLWIGGAVALRLLITEILLRSAEFWFPSIILLISPALVAVVLATFKPGWSAILGYRLILVMFGLLLGGRL